MIVQVYKNTKTSMILLYNKSHPFNKERYEGYEFVEEFEGETWEECNEKMNEKYLNPQKN